MNILFGAEAKSLSVSNHKAVVEVDETTGFVEFPAPGDVKKHLLPVLVDPEEKKAKISGEQENMKKNVQVDEYWMPDKLCKICYKCELPFTMYRRRHHCRMCGQIFCNQCSSFYIEMEQAAVAVGQTVRCCRLCYDQLGASYDQDVKIQLPLDKRRSRKTSLSSSVPFGVKDSEGEDHLPTPPSSSSSSTSHNHSQGGGGVVEMPTERDQSISELEQRASSHLNSIVQLLLSQSTLLNEECDVPLRKTWEDIIVKLVKEVVNFVDPDVRSGDSLDIRPYVKLKIIPGGSLADNAFVNGVVFRKNVSHKKMANEKSNPRLLLLGGGIEFQREDQKLSSLDTLIEQEDKYTEILVEKIMSLKPDIILVGRSVARKAQEILCSHNVVVMQSVKASLLEKVSRMTGALMLPSTDHMIQRYGESCLGSCGRFWLKRINDDESDMDLDSSKMKQSSPNKSRRSSSKVILKRITNKQKCTTYAYLEGCPPELGCTLVLRGGSRAVLSEIKRIIKFSVMLAYHLRLEVAYYTDRCGRLPPQMNIDKSGYESEDDLVEKWRVQRQDEIDEDNSEVHNSHKQTKGDSSSSFMEDAVQRSYLSTSFDVDIKKPYQDEVRYDAAMEKVKSMVFDDDMAFTSTDQMVEISHRSSGSIGQTKRRSHPALSQSQSPEDHQTLLVTSLLMTRISNAAGSHTTTSGKTDGSHSITTDGVGGGANTTSGGMGVSGMGGHQQVTGTQRSRAEVKGIRYYTNQDVALGQFLVESCFQMHDRVHNNTVMMMDHTLSFIHRPGRIDISVSKLPQASSPSGPSGTSGSSSGHGDGTTSSQDKNPGNFSQANAALVNLGMIDVVAEGDERKARGSQGRDPLQAPIFLHSYCKECRSVVTPSVEISDETWKLSFGKFMEMNFYNHSARSRTGGCAHFLRDDHIMSFVCEGFVAQFEFVPIHPLSLHPRSEMQLPLSFHSAMIVNLINECVMQCSRLFEDFAAVIVGLEKIVAHVLSNRGEVLKAIKGDIAVVKQDIERVMDMQASDVEEALQLIQQNKVPRCLLDADAAVVNYDSSDVEVDGKHVERNSRAVLMAIYPLSIRRDMLQKVTFWNSKISVIYRFIDSVEGMNTAPTGGNGGSMEVVDLPDEEDLLLIRSSFVGGEELGDDDVRTSMSASMSPSRNSVRNINQLSMVGHSDLQLNQSSDMIDEGDGNYVKDNEDDSIDDRDTNSGPTLNPSFNAKISSPGQTKEKSTRLTKALQRFTRKGSQESGTTSFAVGIDELCQGRLGLPPGRCGRVIAVHEEELATVIAYSLASDEYHENLLTLLEEDVGIVSGGLGDVHGQDMGESRSGSPKKKKFVPFSTPKMNSKDGAMGRTKSSASTEENDVADVGGGRGRNVRFSSRDIGEDDGVNDDDDDYDDLHLHDQNDEENDEVRMNSFEGKMKIVGDKKSVPAPSQLDTILEDKTPPRNITSSIKTSFQQIVGNSSSPIPPNDSDQIALEDDDDDSSLGNTVGHKSYKYLNFNYNEAMKVKGIGAVKSKAKTSKFESDSHSTGSVVSPPSLTPSTTEGSEESKDVNDKRSSSSSSTKSPMQSAPSLHASSSEATTRESIMISQRKTHIKHRFNDIDSKTNNISCKFICHIFYATQFQAVRAEYLKDNDDDEGFIRSLSMADQWNAQGGKSGASFSRSSDNRFVVKHITRTELQMFLDFAPAYFEYLAKSFYHGLPTLLVKILGVYQLGYHNRLTGKRVMEQVVIMENLFYDRNITRVFDLKGSSRQRYVDIVGENGEKIDDFDNYLLKKRNARRHKNGNTPVKFSSAKVCLDDNLMELTRGKPIPLKHKAKVIFHKAVMNDTLFLSIINIVDYSILVGIDEDTNELVVGIIDYMRQYDIIKRMERMGKSVGTMIAGQAEPTVIQPPQYRKRFQNAMERYFMTVPDKWIQNDI